MSEKEIEERWSKLDQIETIHLKHIVSAIVDNKNPKTILRYIKGSVRREVNKIDRDYLISFLISRKWEGEYRKARQ
jgi:hypothetical protein